jgi:hypothetical protein
VSSLWGLALLAALTPLVGGLVARVARVRWLARLHPDVLPLQAALGTAALTCVCAILSHAGLGQQGALPVVALLSLTLAICNVLPRLRHASRPRARWSAWLPLAAVGAAAAVVGLLPPLWTRSVNVLNDAFYYDAASDWLLLHGVSEHVPRSSLHPALLIVAQLQSLSVRLGTSYLQAFLTALLGASHALLMFYSVSCWGFLLLAGSLYSFGRGVLRLRPWMAAAAVCTTLCVPASTTFALQSGFQAQLHGLTALVAILTVGARLVPRRRWTPGGAVLLATLLAWQVSVYNELLPAMAAAVLAWLAVTLQRACAKRALVAWARLVALVAGAFLVIGNFELVRAAYGLPHQLVAVVGHHIAATTEAWLGLVTGITIFAPGNDVLPGWNRLGLPGGPILPLVLCLVFLVRRRGRHLEHAAAAALLCLALAAAWYALVVPDPWSGAPPHTWSLFKLTQWMQPLVILCAWGCVGRWLGGPRAARVAAALAFLAVGTGLPQHVRYATLVSYRTMAGFAGNPRPLDSLEQLARQLRQLAGQTLYVVTRPHLTNPQYVGLLGYLSLWSPTAGLWTGCRYLDVSIHPKAAFRTDVIPQGEPLTLLCHKPYFPIPHGRPLACSVVAVQAGRDPVLCQERFPAGLGRSPDGVPFAWIAQEPATLVVFSPRPGTLQLSFTVWAPAESASVPATLRLASAMSSSERAVHMADESGFAHVRLYCDVVAGVNEVQLTCTGLNAGVRPADGAVGELRLALRAPVAALF